MMTCLLTCLRCLVLGCLLTGGPADALTGEWELKTVRSRGNINVDIIDRLTFLADGSCVETGYCTAVYPRGESYGKCIITYSVKGVFNVAGGVIGFDFDSDTISVDYEKENMPAVLESMVLKPVVDGFRRSLKKPVSLRILSQTDKKLTIKNESGRNAPEETYIRVH